MSPSQVVDLRWGVPAEQWVDGGTDHALCFQEVETCKKISVGPSFVVSGIGAFFVC